MFTILIIIGVIWFIVSAGSSENNNPGSSTSSNSSNINTNTNKRCSNKSSYSGSSTTSSVSSNNFFQTNTYKEQKCTKCHHSNDTLTSNCEKCGWDMSKVHFHFTTNLAGVTYEGRQGIIAQTKTLDPIKLKRDKNNQYDRNAVGVYNAHGKSLGWVPKGYAANIAPHMDKGTTLYAEIKNIVGGNGYNYGLQVRISNDISKMRDTSITKDKAHTTHSSKKAKDKSVTSTFYNSTSQKSLKGNRTGASSIKSPIVPEKNTSVAVKTKDTSNISESIYLDSILLRHVNKASQDEVQQVLLDFARYKKAALPYMNRQKISGLQISDLESIFDNTIMLAGGSESNFVHRHYKALLVQLAFQLGFLIERLLPDSQYGMYAKNKMNWLSTMDVRLETNLLQGFLNKNVRINGESPIIYDSYKGDQVYLWDIDEIHYVLSNLTELGHKFKQYIDKY